MMSRIFVPTDFSPNADKAMDYAVQLAKLTDAEVILFHAVPPGELEVNVENIKEKMKAMINRIYNEEGVNVTLRIDEGLTISAITYAIVITGATLVVVGTLGNAAIKEKIFGSYTAALLGKTDVPVMVIPLLAHWQLPSKFLIAINKFDESNEVLEPVIALAKQCGASVQVATFTDIADDFVEDYEEHEIKIATYRDQLKQKFPFIEIHAVHLSGNHFKESLEDWIKKNDIDVLVMLTHKRGVIEGVFNHSVTKKMTYHTNIPLLGIPVR
jgi:nucleotide-binding universal stress UspA family protein